MRTIRKTTPAVSASVASQYFLMTQPPLLAAMQGGLSIGRPALIMKSRSTESNSLLKVSHKQVALTKSGYMLESLRMQR